jgi:hypothetical protein
MAKFARSEIGAPRHQLMKELNEQAGASCGKPIIDILPDQTIPPQTSSRRAAVA